MSNKECSEFLRWLYNRLQLKHREDEDVLYKLQYIISQKRIVNQKVHPKLVEDICEKNYPGFFMERSDDLSIGYSIEERNNIRGVVASIILDTLNSEKY